MVTFSLTLCDTSSLIGLKHSVTILGTTALTVSSIFFSRFSSRFLRAFTRSLWVSGVFGFVLPGSPSLPLSCSTVNVAQLMHFYRPRTHRVDWWPKMISWKGMFDICIGTSSKNRLSNLKHPYWVHVFNWYKSTGRLHVCFDRVRTRCNTVQYEDRWIKHQNIKSMNKNINIWSKANDKLIKQRHRWSYFAYDAENDLSKKFRFRGTVRKCLNRVWF